MPQKKQLTYQDVSLTPEQTVQKANEIAVKYSPDAPIRALAAVILRGCKNVPQEGPTRIAMWVQRNVQYLQEAPGIEVLQGPYTTLPSGLRVGDFQFSGIGAGDCDDLSILFACLCRAAGLEAFACGIAEMPYRGEFIHCIGYCSTNKKFYELSLDEPYGGIPNKPLEFEAPPVGQMGLTYDPLTKSWEKYINNPANPAPSYEVTGSFYDSSRAPMNATTMGASSGLPQYPSDRSVFDGSLKYVSPDTLALNANSTKYQAQMHESINLTMERFGEIFENPALLAQDSEIPLGSLLRDPALLTGWGLAAGKDAVGNRFGSTARSIAGTTTVLAANVAGTYAGGSTAATALGQVVGTSATGPVGVAVAAIVLVSQIGVALASSIRKTRNAERLGRRLKSLVREIVDMCVVPGQQLYGGCSEAWLTARLYEIIPFVAGTSGYRTGGTGRAKVKVATYTNPDFVNRNWDVWSSVSTTSPAQSYSYCREEWGMGLIDGSTSAKGINFVGGRRVTATERLMQGHVDATRVIRNFVREVGNMSGHSGTRLITLHNALLVSFMAQVLNIEGQTVRQTGNTPVPIDYGHFWEGFQPAFGGLSIQEAVRPAERLFGAEYDTFDEGGMVDFVTGDQMRWAVTDPLNRGGQPRDQGSGGGGAGVAAAALGAFLLLKGG